MSMFGSYRHLWPAMIAAAIAWLSGPGAVAAPAAPEQAVKAAIVYKLTKFVTWPETAFAASGDRLSICVGESSPFVATLKSLDGRSAQGRVIEVRMVATDRVSRSGCHVLFVSAAELDWADDALRSSADLPVLTVGEGDEFVQRGGIIGLVVEQSRITFVVNLAASERAGIGISAQLLQLATIVRSGGA
jgi:hypothetical protein